MNNNYYSGIERKASDAEVIVREARRVICKISLVIVEGKLTITEKDLVFAAERGTDDGRIDDRIEIENEEPPDSEEKSDGEQTGDHEYDLLIPLENVISASGRKGFLRSSLLITWRDDKTEQRERAEFVQKEKPEDPTMETINLWAPLIEEMHLSRISKIQNENLSLYNSTTNNSLEGRVLALLDDGQWKGLFQITQQLREAYSNEYKDGDAELVEAACKKLAAQKLIEHEENSDFYRKRPKE